MKELRLIRVAEHNDATLGVLLIDNRPMFVTLEDKWRDNQRNVSCIPMGRFLVERHLSPKFGDCFAVKNVPDRSGILIHGGNTHHDTEGCILLGLMYGTLGTDAAILSSRAAMASFMSLMGNDSEALLEIV